MLTILKLQKNIKAADIEIIVLIIAIPKDLKESKNYSSKVNEGKQETRNNN